MRKFTVFSAVFLFLMVMLITVPAIADPIVGRSQAYTVQCDGTARSLALSGNTLNRSIVSFRFFVPGSNAVFIGGSDVNTTVGSGGTGMPYCSTSSCTGATDTIDGNPANFFCRSGSTVQVVVLGGVR